MPCERWQWCWVKKIDSEFIWELAHARLPAELDMKYVGEGGTRHVSLEKTVREKGIA